MKRVCEVCRLIDKDETPKEGAYCAFCGAWICTADRLRPDRRAKAAFLRSKSGR